MNRVASNQNPYVGSVFILPLLFFSLVIPYLDGRYSVLPIRYVYACFLISFIFFFRFLLSNILQKNNFVLFIFFNLLAIVSTVGSGIPSAFMYLLPLVVMSFIKFDGIRCVFSSRDVFITISVWLLLLFPALLLIIFGSGLQRGFFPWIGNPNYTAMIAVGSFSAAGVLIGSRLSINSALLRCINYSTFLIFLVVTQSRGAILAFVCCVFMKLCIRVIKEKWIRFFAIFLLFMSIAAQLILFQIGNVVGYADAGRGLFDASNEERFSVFNVILMLIWSDPFFIYSGVGDVENFWIIFDGELDNVPHNWFMMMWLGNGLLFALSFFLSIWNLLLRIPIAYIPYTAMFIVFSTSLGRGILFAPFLIFLMAVFIDQQRRR